MKASCTACVTITDRICICRKGLSDNLKNRQFRLKSPNNFFFSSVLKDENLNILASLYMNKVEGSFLSFTLSQLASPACSPWTSHVMHPVCLERRQHFKEFSQSQLIIFFEYFLCINISYVSIKLTVTTLSKFVKLIFLLCFRL